MALTELCPGTRVDPNHLRAYSRETEAIQSPCSLPFNIHHTDDVESLQGPWVITRWQPPVDIELKVNTLSVIMDVPGVESGSLEVAIYSGVLRIKGERASQSQHCDTPHRIERQNGPFVRCFQLPKNAMPNQMKATYLQGILRILIPLSSEPSFQLKLRQDSIRVRLT